MQDFQELLDLTPSEKIMIVDRLLESLDSPDKEIEEAWLEEAERRLELYDQGKISSIPAEKVFEKYGL